MVLIHKLIQDIIDYYRALSGSSNGQDVTEMDRILHLFGLTIIKLSKQVVEVKEFHLTRLKYLICERIILLLNGF